jgi:hypothetical protein
MSGLLIGLVRMILDFVYVEPACGEEDLRPVIVKDVKTTYLKAFFFENYNSNYYYIFQVSLFVFCHVAVLHDRNRHDRC